MLHKKFITYLTFFSIIHIATNTYCSDKISTLEQIVTVHNLAAKTPQIVCKTLNGHYESPKLKKTTHRIIRIGENLYTKNNYGDWTLYDASLPIILIDSKYTEPGLSEKHTATFEAIKNYITENPSCHILNLLNLNLPAPDKTEITINGTVYRKARHGKWYQPDAKVYSLHPNNMPEVQSAKSLALSKKSAELSKKRASQLKKLIKTYNLTQTTAEETLHVLNEQTTKLQAPNYTKITIGKNTYCKSFKGPWFNTPQHKK